MLTVIALMFLLVGVVLLLGAQVLRRYADVRRRLGEVESQLDRMAERMGLPDSVPDLTRVREHLDRGDTAEAVREFRRMTGADLVTATNAVEAMRGA